VWHWTIATHSCMTTRWWRKPKTAVTLHVQTAMLQRKRRTQENTGPAWLNNLNSTRLSHLMPWNLELYVNREEIKLFFQCNSIYTSNMPFSFFAVLVRLLGYIDSRTFINLQWTSLRWWPLPEVVLQTQLAKSGSPCLSVSRRADPSATQLV